jgi:hypothetical protein
MSAGAAAATRGWPAAFGAADVALAPIEAEARALATSRRKAVHAARVAGGASGPKRLEVAPGGMWPRGMALSQHAPGLGPAGGCALIT